MNKIFKVIWNHSTQSWVAVAEFAKSHTKSTAAVGLSSVSTVLTKFFALSSITIAIASMVGVANAATIDGEVVGTSNNGQVVIYNGGAGTGNNANMIIIGDSASTGRTNSIKIGTGISDTDTGGGGSVIVGNKTHTGGGGKDSFSVAVGNYGFVAGPSVAIGVYAKADPYDSTGANNLKAGQIAIGAGANTGVNSNDAGMAIGTIASARSNGSVAVGRLSLAGTYAANEGFGNGARFSTAIGEQTTARGYESIALGGYAMTGRNVRNQGFSGAGAGQISSGAYAIAIGGESRAINRYTLALGQDAIAGGYTAEDAATVRSWVDEAQKVRDEAKARYDTALAVYNSKNQNTYTEEIMREALESGVAYERAEADLWRAKEDVKLILEDDKVKDVSGAIAVGSSARALNKDSIAFGTGAKVYGEQSIAIGTGNLVTGNYSGVFGDPSINAGTASYIFGNDNGIGNTTSSAFILGNNNTIGSTATYNAEGKIQTNAPLEGIRDASSSFAIGNYNSITTDRTYVLGSGINTRDTLGEIKQLHGTVANSVYLGDDSDAMGSINNGVNAQGAGTLRNRVLNKSVVGNTTGGMGAVTNATVNGVTYGTFAGTTPVGIVTVGASGAERRIQNIAAGEISSTSTDAINGSQLYAVVDKIDTSFNILDNSNNKKGTVTAGENVKFENGTNTTVYVGSEAGNTTPISYSVNTAKLSSGINDVFSVASGSGDAFVTAADLTTALNNTGFWLSGGQSGGSFTDNGGDKRISHNDTFKLIAKKGISITQVDNGYEIGAELPSTTLNVIDAGSVQEVSPANADSVVSAKDLAEAINKTGFTVTSNKAKDDTNSDAKVSPGDTLNFNNGTGTTVTTSGSNVTVNVKQATAPTAGTNGKLTNPASNAADSFLTAANVVDAINASGFTLKTSATDEGKKEEGEDELINPGDTVEMVAGKNLTVKQEATGKVTYATKEDVSFTSINVGAPNEDGSENDNPIYIGAKDGKNVITGLDTTLPDPAGNSGTKPANVNAISNQAATLGDVLNAGWNLQGNSEAVDFVKPYDTVNFKDGANTKVVAKANDEGTSSDIQINVTGLPVQYTTAEGTPVAKVGDNYYPVDENGLPDTSADPVEAGDLITNVINPAAKPNEKGDETTLGNVKSGLETTNVPTAPTGKDGDKATSPLINLNNEDVPDTNVATVGDLRNMGWVVSAEGNDYTDTVKNANEVKFKGTGLATVTGETKDGVREITVNVDAQAVVEAAQQPVVYTNAEGDKLTKVDGNFYKVEDIDEETGKPKDNAEAVKPADVIASMNNGDNSTTKPMTLTNIKSNLPSVNDADTTITNPDGTKVAADPANITKAPITAQQAADLAKNSANNAATLGDVLNAGWNLQGNSEAVDFVKPYDTVNFKDGANTKVVAKANDEGTSSDIQINVTGLPVQYTTAEGTPVAKVGDNYYPVDENGLPDTSADPVEAGDLITNVINPAAKPNEKGDETTLGNVKSGLETTNVPTAPTGKDGDKATSPLINLNNEDVPDTNVATVGDLRNMGWVVSAEGNDYTDTVKNANEVKFKGTGLATVTGETKDGVREITVNVDAQAVVEAAQQPVVYTNAEGDKLTKVDGNFYKVEDIDEETGKPKDNAEAVKPADVIASMNNGDNSTTKPMTLTNIKSNLPSVNDADTTITNPDGTKVAADPANITKAPITAQQAADLAKNSANNAATLGDVLNAGWNLQGNGKAVDFVKPFDTVNFVNGEGTVAEVKTDDNLTSTVTYNVNVDNTTTEITYTNKDGDKVYKVGDQYFTNPEGTDDAINTEENPVTSQVSAKTTPLEVNKTGDEAGKVKTPANKDSLATAGDIANAINNSGWKLAAKGTPGEELINPSETVTFETGSDNLTVKRDGANIIYDLAKDIKVDSVKAGDTTINNNGLTIENGPSVTKDGIDAAGNKITNVAAGKDDTDAVNVSQLKQAQAAATTKVDGNQGVTVTPTNNADGSTTYTVTAKTDGNTVTVDKDGNIAAVTSKLSNVAEGQPNAGKVNTPANENALATAGDIANAINNSGFTLKTSGNKLSGSDELINPGDVIDMVAGKNLTVKQEANGKVTYATKDDVVFDSVQLGDTGPKITNKDGDINVGGNGSPVKITGVADGDISPDSKDAINGSQLYTALSGAKTDVKSEDKSVTVTPNGNTFDLSVNTDDVTITKDPTTGAVKAVTSGLAVNNEGGVNTPAAPNALATAGDIANAINNSGWNLAAEGTDGTELINPSDKVTFKAGSKNLTVKRDGADITYDLAKDITVDSVKAGDTVMNNDGITINNGAAGEPVSLTKNGLNNGGNRITNVKAGEAPTDAVNVSQLKGVANQLDNKINRNNRNLRAGIAGANAAAGLPQVYIPGKSMVAAAAGTYRGEAALAVGYSRASDNGKVILKLQGNANTRGDIGGSVGIGYQW